MKLDLSKKWRQIFLSLLLVIMLGCGYYYIHISNVKKNGQEALKTDALQFAHYFLDQVSFNWNPEDFKKFAHPFLLATVVDKDVQKAFVSLSRLGTLKYDNCALSNLAVSNESVDRLIVADFICNSEFENAHADIILQIKQDHLKSPWKVSSFNVTPINLPDSN